MSEEITQQVSTVSAERDTIADRVLEDVLKRISNGDLHPGSVLNEVELSRLHAVSRGPVREAIRRLEGRKLVVCAPFMRTRIVALGPAEIRDVFEMREALEGMATRLACERMTDAELVRLVEGAREAAADFDIHTEIAQACGNERIRALLCDELYYLLRLYRRQSGEQPGRRAEAAEEHWQIAIAVQQRNAAMAESLMRSHIRRATARLTDSK